MRKDGKTSKSKKDHRKIIAKKKISYEFTRKIYKELKLFPEFIFKKMRGYSGEYDYSTDEITLDYRKELLPTLIHEYLHKWNYDKSETWVLKQEKKIINALTPKQIRNILKLLGDSI